MTCSVPSCERLVEYPTLGYCGMHYHRVWRTGEVGSPLPTGWATPQELPNPWVKVSPPCPRCGEKSYGWSDEGPLRWFCPPCGRRFDP